MLFILLVLLLLNGPENNARNDLLLQRKWLEFRSSIPQRLGWHQARKYCLPDHLYFCWSRNDREGVDRDFLGSCLMINRKYVELYHFIAFSNFIETNENTCTSSYLADVYPIKRRRAGRTPHYKRENNFFA